MIQLHLKLTRELQLLGQSAAMLLQFMMMVLPLTMSMTIASTMQTLRMAMLRVMSTPQPKTMLMALVMRLLVMRMRMVTIAVPAFGVATSNRQCPIRGRREWRHAPRPHLTGRGERPKGHATTLRLCAPTGGRLVGLCAGWRK